MPLNQKWYINKQYYLLIVIKPYSQTQFVCNTDHPILFCLIAGMRIVEKIPMTNYCSWIVYSISTKLRIIAFRPD